MNYFDSDMFKSTNTVVYFDLKTVIYIYVCGQYINENGNSMAIYVPFQFNLFLALENCFLSYLWSYVKTIPALKIFKLAVTQTVHK
jgi:hypothetical protein